MRWSTTATVAGGGGCCWLAHYCASCSGTVSLGDRSWSLVSGEFMCFLSGLILDHRKNTNKTSALKQTSSSLLRFFCQSVFQVDFGINCHLPPLQRYPLGIHCWGRERKKINNTMGNEDLVAYMVRKQRAQQAQQAFEAGRKKWVVRGS